MTQPDYVQRFEAIHQATLAKLASRAKELSALDMEARVQRLTEEALAEFYDDPVKRFHAAEFVDRIVRRSIAEAQASAAGG